MLDILLLTLLTLTSSQCIIILNVKATVNDNSLAMATGIGKRYKTLKEFYFMYLPTYNYRYGFFYYLNSDCNHIGYELLICKSNLLKYTVLSHINFSNCTVSSGT